MLLLPNTWCCRFEQYLQYFAEHYDTGPRRCVSAVTMDSIKQLFEAKDGFVYLPQFHLVFTDTLLGFL